MMQCMLLEILIRTLQILRELCSFAYWNKNSRLICLWPYTWSFCSSH